MKIPTITTSNTIPRAEKPAPGTSHQPQVDSEFQPGQLLKAKVMTGSTSDGKVLLDVAGQKISAKSLVKLAAGDHIWLEVNRGGTDPLLSLAPQKGAVHHYLQILFASPHRPDNLFNLLLPLLNQISPETENSSLSRLLISLGSASQDSTPDPGGVRLMTLLYGGLNLDIKMNGRESAVQQLKHLLSWEKFSPSLQKLLSETIDFLDRHQQINTSPPGRDGSPLFLFPCFFKEETGWGEWMFSKTGKSNSAKSSFELNFFLDMSKLGPLSLQISCNDKDLNGKFHLSKQQVVDYMKKKAPELEKLMYGLGYQSVYFQCHLSRKNILMELKNSLMKQAGLNRFSLLDITA
ncbi:MAG: hypothetical protein R6V20_04460 [Desulfobia sp.]